MSPQTHNFQMPALPYSSNTTTFFKMQSWEIFFKYNTVDDANKCKTPYCFLISDDSSYISAFATISDTAPYALTLK